MILIQLANKFYFLHVLYSIILILGLSQIGSYIFKIRQINNIISQISEIKYQKIFISVNLILLIFYPLILYSKNVNFIPYLSISIFFLEH